MYSKLQNGSKDADSSKEQIAELGTRLLETSTEVEVFETGNSQLQTHLLEASAEVEAFETKNSNLIISVLFSMAYFGHG